MKIKDLPVRKSVNLTDISVGECFKYPTGYQLYMKIADTTIRGDIKIVLLRSGTMYEESADLEVVPVDATIVVNRIGCIR